MENDSIEYKGFVVKAHPYKTVDSKKWRARVAIHWVGHESHGWSFIDSGLTYDHKEEAVEHCFEFGRRIIDRQEKGIPVQVF